MNSNGILLEGQQLVCIRGERTLFTDLDMRAAAGDLLHVTGPNGAGKTSLLRILCGLLAPESGKVLWRGEPTGRQREVFHRELLYVGHAPAVKDELSVLENLRYATAMGGCARPDGQLIPALQWAGLAAFEDAPARTLSQGQRRRLALSRMMVADEARLWILDEPFVALDHAALDTLAERLHAHRESGGVIVLTTHQALPARLADARTLTIGIRRSAMDAQPC